MKSGSLNELNKLSSRSSSTCNTHGALGGNNCCAIIRGNDTCFALEDLLMSRSESFNEFTCLKPPSRTQDSQLASTDPASPNCYKHCLLSSRKPLLNNPNNALQLYPAKRSRSVSEKLNNKSSLTYHQHRFPDMHGLCGSKESEEQNTNFYMEQNEKNAERTSMAVKEPLLASESNVYENISSQKESSGFISMCKSYQYFLGKNKNSDESQNYIKKNENDEIVCDGKQSTNHLVKHAVSVSEPKFQVSETDSFTQSSTYSKYSTENLSRNQNSLTPLVCNHASLDHTKTRFNFNYYQRQRQTLILTISKGTHERKLITSAELLKIVLCHNQGSSFDDASGSLKLRDLRKICSQKLGGRHASIELRRNCILFNLIFVRCIIMHEKIVFFPKDIHFNSNINISAFDSEKLPRNSKTCENKEKLFLRKLTQISELKDQFEFAVLESLLVEVCSSLTDSLGPIIEATGRIETSGIGYLSSALHLREISDLKRRVDSFTDIIRSIDVAIQELLNNEEDLRRLELSRFWKNPNEWENPPDSSTSEDAEMLLECYAQEIDSMLRHINRIDESLDDMLQMIQLHLASIRNTFLKAELGLDIVGTVVTFVACLAGIFGMNLPNGYENNSHIFWPLSNLMIIVCGLTVAFTILMFRKLKL